NTINFFFQAEDGIRDKLVTGVQTCALPISASSGSDRRRGRGPRSARDRRGRDGPTGRARQDSPRPAGAPPRAAGSRGFPRWDCRSEERRVGKECGCGWWGGGCEKEERGGEG